MVVSFPALDHMEGSGMEKYEMKRCEEVEREGDPDLMAAYPCVGFTHLPGS